MAALAWSLRIDRPRTGAENMALDHTLARVLPAGRAAVRLYRWSTPTLSLGRNEPARGLLDVEALRRDGVDWVRRPTGGRSVLHDHELTYAVVAPIRALGGVRAAYGAVNRALATGLAELGVRAATAEGEPTRPLDAGPCFGGAAPGEVVVGGRKLVGSAQARMGDVLLQHGSILIRDDQWRLERYRTGTSEHRAPRSNDASTAPSGDGAGSADGAGPAPALDADPADSLPASLVELLGRRVSAVEVAEAVTVGFRRVLPGDWRAAAGALSLEGGDLPSRPASDLLERYRSDDWSWRR